MAIADVKEYTHLSEEEVEQLGRELDAIRAEVEESRNAADAAYINRLIRVQRGLAAGVDLGEVGLHEGGVPAGPQRVGVGSGRLQAGGVAAEPSDVARPGTDGRLDHDLGRSREHRELTGVRDRGVHYRHPGRGEVGEVGGYDGGPGGRSGGEEVWLVIFRVGGEEGDFLGVIFSGLYLFPFYVCVYM